MGKKGKKQPRSTHKDKRVSCDSPKNVLLKSTSNAVTGNDKVVVVKDRRICLHLEKGIDLDALRTKLGSSEPLKCEDCREGIDDRRANKGRGKQNKKKGGGNVKSESKSIWVCLACGHFSCGGVGLPTTPQSHAIRHARLNHHHLTALLENPQLCWCFTCSTLVHHEKTEGSAEQNHVLHEIAKMIKGWASESPALDVEEIGFGSGSLLNGSKRETCPPVSSDERGCYSVRGMLNLGNTCFFNSVMQNLLAIDQLRDYFLKLDASLGPLTTALKKLVVEISEEPGGRNAVNPRALFGSVCAKAPQFRGYQQQDSHEFLRCLLDGLSTEELSSRGKIKSAQDGGKSEPTFVQDMFGGQLCSSVTCLECGHSSIVYEPFLDLSLPVPTKRPPSGKAQPAARTRKPKLPPRRNGRARPKLNTNSNALPSESSKDKIMCGKTSSEGQSSMCTVEDNEPKHCVDNDIQKQALPGGLTWLDYLDVDIVSSTNAVASECSHLPLNQEYAAETAEQDDVPLQDSVECSRLKSEICRDTAKSLDKVTPMDSVMRENLSDFQDLTSQVNEKLVLKDLVEDVAAMGAVCVDNDNTSSDAYSQTCSRELNVEAKPAIIFSKEETPLLLEDNVILLLPYESISRTEGEVSSSSLGYEQGSLDFDGLGSLFDEPEDAGILSMNPSTVDKPLEEIKTVESGFMGNSSESEPDEVDGTEAPISVERCLSYFIKSELLTKNEHGWQCENCSKILQERMRLRKKLQNPFSESLLNQNEDRENASSKLGFHRHFAVPNGVSHLSNGTVNRKEVNTFDRECILKSSEGNDMNPVASQCEETKGEFNVAPVDSPESFLGHESLNQANGDYKQFEDFNADKPDAAPEGDYAAPEGDFLSASGGSEASEDEKSSENFKVERNATKRILINKAPYFLTIHLKRFSQDARGRLSKLSGHVHFNHTIDLKPYIDPRCKERNEYKYRLVGVVEHMGTMKGGHYVAYVRGSVKSIGKDENAEENYVWCNANDAYVRECSLEEVLRSDAYILFYAKV